MFEIRILKIDERIGNSLHSESREINKHLPTNFQGQVIGKMVGMNRDQDNMPDYDRYFIADGNQIGGFPTFPRR